MTREDAIDIFEHNWTRLENHDYTEKELNEALNIAIKALEQEPCEDAISRQAVLDYIDKMPSELTTDGRRMIRRRTLEEYISDTLPSVNPQEPKTDVLDKIRAEIEEITKPNELGGRGNGKSIRYGLCMALDIIDKYKESEVSDASSN